MASRREIEPPPAPISIKSITGTLSGIPDPLRKRRTRPASNVFACSGSKFSMRHIFAVVPPISNVSRFGNFIFLDRNNAPETPATGPDSRENTGLCVARLEVIIPPLDCMIDTGALIPISFSWRLSEFRYVFIMGIK